MTQTTKTSEPKNQTNGSKAPAYTPDSLSTRIEQAREQIHEKKRRAAEIQIGANQMIAEANEQLGPLGKEIAQLDAKKKALDEETGLPKKRADELRRGYNKRLAALKQERDAISKDVQARVEVENEDKKKVVEEYEASEAKVSLWKDIMG